MRSGLLQNFVIKPPTFTESFNNLSDWTQGGDAGGIIALDTSDYPSGTSGSMIITPTSSWPGVTIIKSINHNFGADKTIGKMWIKSPDTIANGTPITLALSPVSDFSRRFDLYFDRTGANDRPISSRWKHMTISLSNFVATGTISWNETMNYCRLRIVDSGGSAFKVAFLELGLDSRAKCVLQFDGGNSTDYTVAYPYLSARNIKATQYIFDDGIGNVGSCTLSQLQELYVAGWGIGLYPHGGPQDIRILTEPQQETVYKTVRDYLISNGMPRAMNSVAYSEGAYNNDTLIALANLGIKTGRTTIYTPTPIVTPHDNNFLLFTREINQEAVKSLYYALTAIDYAIQTGSTVMFLIHRITNLPGTYDITISDFYALIDYLYSKRTQIDCLTIDEWYNELTQPHYKSTSLRSLAGIRKSAGTRLLA